MVHNSCCVVNCKNTGRNSDCKFYTFPVASWKLEKRKQWIIAVKRKKLDGSPWTPKPTDTICSDHFAGGKKSEEEASPSYIPTIFPSAYKKSKINEKTALSRRVKNNLPTITTPTCTPPPCNKLQSVIQQPASLKSQPSTLTHASTSSHRSRRRRQSRSAEIQPSTSTKAKGWTPILTPPQVESNTSEEGQHTSEVKDKYDVFGKYVALKVRQLDKKQRAFVERIIHEVIYEGQMGHLNVNSLLVLDMNTYRPVLDSDDNLKKAVLGKEIKIEATSDEIEESPSLYVAGYESYDKVSFSKRQMQMKNIPHEQRIVTEDQNLRGDLKNEYLVHTQQPYIEVAASHNTKRMRFVKIEHAETHSKLEEHAIKSEIEFEENWIPQTVRLKDEDSHVNSSIGHSVALLNSSSSNAHSAPLSTATSVTLVIVPPAALFTAPSMTSSTTH